LQIIQKQKFMHKIILSGFFSCFLFIYISAQQLPVQWVRTFTGQGKNPDRIASIHTDSQGNVYVAGYAGRHHGSPDAFAMKRSPQGDTLWTYYYDSGAKNEDYATDLTTDNSGNVYITGNSTGSNYFDDCITIKLSSSGIPVWERRYSPGGNLQSYGNAIAVDASGNVYVAGYTDPISGSNDWLVLKYNSSGTLQWADVLNGPGNGEDAALDIAIAPNGNPTVCGYTYSVNASGGINAFVKQYTPSNGTAWTDTWTNPQFTGTDKLWGLAFIMNGDLLVGGETKNGSGSNMDSFAMRYDQNGNRIWATIYADGTTTQDEYIRKVTVDLSGNVFLTGTDYQDGYVTCIRNDGTMGWRKKWRGPLTSGSEVFHSVTTDVAGNVYVTGRGVFQGPDYYGNGGMTNMIIAKYSPSGDSLWTYRSQLMTRPSMGFDITYRNGKIYAGGFVTDTAYINENLYTIILDTAGTALHEWIFNGQGDAVTMGQFVVTDQNSNVYCAATLDRLYAEGTDVVLIKYNPAGDLLWEKYYSSGGFHNDTVTDMKIDNSGNIILCLSSDINKLKNNYRLSLLKADQNGNFTDTSWFASPGSILAVEMEIAGNGSIAIAANSNINGGILVYYDSTFQTVWSAKIDSTQFAATKANCISLYQNGDIGVGGYTSLSGITAGIVQRFDDSGNKLWTSVIDSLSVFDEIRDISINQTDETVFTGRSGNKAITGKIDGTNGSIIWRKIYDPATTSESGVKVRFTPAGNIALICRGWTGFVARYYTLQYTGSGTFQWAMTYSQTASDREPLSLLIEPNNNVVTAGWAINATSTNYDYVLAGYNSAGINIFTNTYTTAATTNWDQLRSMTRDNLGYIIVTGQTASEFYNTYLFKILTIKYGGLLVDVEEEATAQSVRPFVYPNPSSNGVFELYDASPDCIAAAYVFDMQGKSVAALSLSTFQADLSRCSPGTYFLILRRNNGTTESIKMIKSR
jgi:uncharacterized delta-60 repeat protein